MLTLLLLGFSIAAIVAFSVSPTNGSVNGASFQAFRVSCALVTAPPGALLRWKLGARLNGKCTRGPFAKWPLGTLVANLLASALLGVIAGACAIDAFGPVTASYGAWYAEAMLQGLGTGFCGCLSTVSTWINEVSVLLAPTPDAKAKGGYSCRCTAVSYALGTVGLGLAVSVPCFLAVKAAGS
jgi:fluoride ion exporter CrcB/FEX